jgi:hypothetical protein
MKPFGSCSNDLKAWVCRGGILLAGCWMLGQTAGGQGTQPTSAQPATPSSEPAPSAAKVEPRVIDILADHDSRYKIGGQDRPMIKLTAGEVVKLRIMAVKAKNHNRDGAVHGFTLLHAKDRTPVDGWDFMLKPGLQEFLVTAPTEPGDYIVVCTVICSSGHEQMNMKVVVVPQGG